MSAEGKPVLTDAPWSTDHGGENTGRFPLRSIVDGVSREAWKRETLPHRRVGHVEIEALNEPRMERMRGEVCAVARQLPISNCI
jgi:hypothetical protein